MKNYGDDKNPTLGSLNELVDKIMEEAGKLGMKMQENNLSSCAYCLKNNLPKHECCEIDAFGKREIICFQCLDLLQNPEGFDLPNKFFAKGR